MKRPSITMPGDMLDEIEDRRPKGTRRSEYVRQAIRARFALEDSEEWPVDEE